MTRPDEEGQSSQLAAALRLHSHPMSAPTPECLDELDVAALVDGALSGAPRERAVAHLAGCARCSSRLRGTAALVADPQVAREMPEVRARRWALPAVAFAAAAVVLLVVWPRERPRDPGQLREPAVTSTIAPIAVAPRDSMARHQPLVWTSVPGAHRYRVRLQGADGSLLWSSQTSDTSVVLPDSVRLSAATPYYWQVEAQTEWQRWVGSDLQRFILRASR